MSNTLRAIRAISAVLLFFGVTHLVVSFIAWEWVPVSDWNPWGRGIFALASATAALLGWEWPNKPR